MTDDQPLQHDGASNGNGFSDNIEEYRRSMGYDSPDVSAKERLSHFTWAWFECTMATGALATVLGQQPYEFRGLRTIGAVVYVLDLALFVAFCALIACRFALHPPAFLKSLHHPQESFYFGNFWVSVAFILYGAQQYGVPACGPWLVRALEVVFWAYAACALLVCIFQYHIIFDEEELPVTEAMPAWILPAYPFLVLGPLAAVLLYSQPSGAGTPIWLGGLAFNGLGWSITFIMYTIYVTRLVNSKLPEPSKRPGMFVAVGPAGYTSSTFAALGDHAPDIVPANYLGLPADLPTGYIWKAMAVPAAVFVWLLGFWFFALAAVACWRGRRHMHFTMNYWAFVFPQAGLTVGAIQIANAIDSAGIHGVASAMTVGLAAAWLLVAALNVRAVARREVLWPGRDEDLEDWGGNERLQ
ncbi:C4-dicarboxylate transporter/malic acid transport protein-like protein [Xylariaceae sp. FL0804]|nr:C4-dicarboxylate transporter/malic acid transport protein-like protein [Xylariaceae sp. FL0804]